MTAYPKSLARFFGLVAIMLLCLGFMSSWSFFLGMIAVFIGIPVVAGILLIGSIKHFIDGLKNASEIHCQKLRWGNIAASPAMLFVMIGLALPIVWSGKYFGSFTRLMVNMSHYESIIAKARTSEEVLWFEKDDGVTYSVDRGPPLRIAFNPEGILDNWSGIIYDPTGEVMLADGIDPQSGKFVAPDRITKLFNGDLVKCRKLWGHYYWCSFT